jgi:hypothetical protein
MNTWIEFMTRPSEHVVALFKKEYDESGDPYKLRNLVLALVDAGKWQCAYELSGKCYAETGSNCDFDLILMGLCQWFLSQENAAIELWRTAMDAEYTDICGAIDSPLILYYAGRRLGDQTIVDDSLKALKRFWRIRDHTKVKRWPGTPAIAGYLIGAVPGTIVLNEWKQEIQPLEYRRQCRVNFWMGVTLLGRPEEEAASFFKSAFTANKIGVLQYEYFLAKWEYSRLTGQPWPVT